jgi:hypothetical protein
MYEPDSKDGGGTKSRTYSARQVEFVRKIDRYFAAPVADGTWQVTNKRTGKSALLTDKEFRAQFEPVKEPTPAPENKKWQPSKFTPLEHEVVDLPDGRTEVRIKHISEDL